MEPAQLSADESPATIQLGSARRDKTKGTSKKPKDSDESREGIIETFSQAPEITIEANRTIAAFAAKNGLGRGVVLDQDLIDQISDDGTAKYIIGEQIAAGGMGAILEARDANLMRRVAMKVLKHPNRATNEQLARFIEEAQITGQLQHPGIVPVHELGLDANNQPFYTMKLLEGRTLKAILADLQQGQSEALAQWSLPRLVNAFARVCEAIQYAHSRRVLHRDLKPENIMTGGFGEIQVLDWGLAKVLDRQQDQAELPPLGPDEVSVISSVRADDDSERFVSMDGTIAGTPAYMAPEQAQGKVHELDERTDVFGLGAILYQILTLVAPLGARGTQAASVLAARTCDIPAPAEREEASRHHLPGGRVPPALAAIAMKALARRPADRYPDAGSLLADIESYQRGFATQAEDAGALARIRLFVKRHKLATIFSTLLLAAIVLGGNLSFVQARRATAALKQANTEESKRLAAEKGSAAPRLKAARVLIREGDYDNAEQALALVRQYDPYLAPHFDQAILATRRGALTNDTARTDAYTEALAHLDAVEATPESDNTLHQGLREILTTGIEQPHIEFPRHAYLQLADQAGYNILATSFADTAEQQLTRYRAQIESAWPGQGIGLTLSPKGTFKFEQVNSAPPVANLAAFRGIPITTATLTPAIFPSLEPFRGMPLQSLRIGYSQRWQTALQSFAGLENSPLERLDAGYLSNLSTLAHLEAIPTLSHLTLFNCGIEDTSGLAMLPLHNLSIQQSWKKSKKLWRFEDFPLDSLIERLSLNLTNTERPTSTQMARLSAKNLDIPRNWLAGEIHLLSHAPNLRMVGSANDKYKFLNVFSSPAKQLLAENTASAIVEIDEITTLIEGKPWATGLAHQLALFKALIRDGSANWTNHADFRHFKGSAYYLLPAKLSWAEADQIAQRLGGHLAVADTDEELQFLANAFPRFCWLGAKPAGNLGLQWVTGAPWSLSPHPAIATVESGYLVTNDKKIITQADPLTGHNPIIEFAKSSARATPPPSTFIERYLPVDPEPHLQNPQLKQVVIANKAGVLAMLDRHIIPGVPPGESLQNLVDAIAAPGFAPLQKDLAFIGAASRRDPAVKAEPGPLVNFATNSFLGLVQHDGHTYLPVDKPLTWHEADIYARVVGGHLATITSAEENAFLAEHLPPGQFVWLGATDRQEEGTWRWETGESFDWENWAEGEPNAYQLNEDLLAINRAQADTWWDVQPNKVGTLIIEWTPDYHPEQPTSAPLDSLFHCLRIPQEHYRSEALERLREVAVDKADSNLVTDIDQCLALCTGKTSLPTTARGHIDWREYQEGSSFACIPIAMSKADAVQVANALGARLAQPDHDQLRHWLRDGFGKDHPGIGFRIGGHVSDHLAFWDVDADGNAPPWIEDEWPACEPNGSSGVQANINLIGSRPGRKGAVPGAFDDDNRAAFPLLQWGTAPTVDPNQLTIRSASAQVEALAGNSELTGITIENGDAFTRWLCETIVQSDEPDQRDTALAELKTTIRAPAFANFQNDIDLFRDLLSGDATKPDPSKPGLVPWLNFDGHPVLWVPLQLPRPTALELAASLKGTLISLDSPDSPDPEQGKNWFEKHRPQWSGNRFHVNQRVVHSEQRGAYRPATNHENPASCLIIWE